MAKKTILFASTLAAAAVAAAACSTGQPASPSANPSASGDSPDGAVPASFQAVPPSVYVAKVKNVLVGLPPTDAEIAAVAADPTALRGLIDGWTQTPEYRQKMLTFFELAFQQTQITNADFADQVFPEPGIGPNPQTQPALLQNVKEMFARTVLELIAEGRPLTEAMTTTRFMMTPALMELYAFLDSWQVDDAGKVTDRFAQANPSLSIYAEAAAGPIALSDSLDPNSANYMHFYDADVAKLTNVPTGCATDPVVYPASSVYLHYVLHGSLRVRKNPNGTGTCSGDGGSKTTTQFQPSDFSTWQMVTIRPPKANEKPTAFYDLPKLRTATELVAQVPRVGFFSTPAFFANWQTNMSNQMRVTLNQALIVATGAAIDGSDSTTPSSTPGLDSEHAAPGSACFSCHQLLDPTRSILASTYSWNYHDQTDTSLASQKGLFAFQNVIKPVASIGDFAQTLATHPLVAQAWAEKLCYYANSESCETNDPEFQRIVSAFQSSGFSWNVLVRELLSSPITTHAAPTQTATDLGEVVAVSRRDHLCAALNNRLGLTDVCALDALTPAMLKTAIPEIVSGLPSDGYGRGATAPVLPNQPSLFFRAGTENICASVAALVVDPAAGVAPAGAKQWSSKQPDAAIADFVHIVMALPSSDPRATPAAGLLSGHFKAAVQGGATPTDALRSTFITACLAPSAVSIGL